MKKKKTYSEYVTRLLCGELLAGESGVGGVAQLVKAVTSKFSGWRLEAAKSRVPIERKK